MLKPRIPKTRQGRFLLWFGLALLLCGLVAYHWNFGNGTAGPVAVVQPSPGNGSARPAASPRPSKLPWNSGSNQGSPQAGMVSVATPVLDQWMESHWDEADDKVIDGLLGLSGKSDLGLAEQSRALEHALNLLPDTDYPKLDSLLLDPKTSPDILQQVFTDLHNRSERASLHAALHLAKREELEIRDAAKGFLAHWLDLDEENELEAIRLQAETRLIELDEEEPVPPDMIVMDPKEPIPAGLHDATVPAPDE